MKLTKAERACIAITLVLVGFVAGFYLRGNALRDAVIIETERTVDHKAAPEAVSSRLEVEPPESSLQVAAARTTVDSDEDLSALGDAVPSPININTATLEELDGLPGIGPALAERIISFRETYGPFAATEEIMLVSGIGEKTFEKLRNLITVEE